MNAQFRSCTIRLPFIQDKPRVYLSNMYLYFVFVIILIALLTLMVVGANALMYWLAFSGKPLLARGLLFSGLVFIATGLLRGPVAEIHWVEFFVAVFYFALMISGVFSMSGRISQWIAVVFCAIPFCYLAWNRWGETQNPESLVLFMIGLLVAFAIAAFHRALGFRVVRLTQDATDREFALSTGKSVDDWIKTLCKNEAHQWTRDRIMAWLDHRGLSYQWRKRIADAYETSIGRIVVNVADGTRPQTVQSEAQKSWIEMITAGSRESRISIRTLAIAVVNCAIVLAFVRPAQWEFPDVMMCIAIALSVGASGILMAITMMSLLRVHRGRLRYLPFILQIAVISSCSTISALAFQRYRLYSFLFLLVAFAFVLIWQPPFP